MAQESDRALEALDRRGPELYAILLRLTVRRDVAQELFQELFMKLAASKGFQEVEDCDGYVFRTAIHLAMDWRRQEHRERKVLREPRPEKHETSALEQLIHDERVERVLSALSSLTDLEQEAFVLRHLEQLNYQAVAQRLGKTEHQARGLCHRAIESLRQTLGIANSAGVRDE